MKVLEVSNLTKQFSSGIWPFATRQTFVAVNGISFDLEEGQIVGLLGANGAGKTTTIQMLLDILTPTSGDIRYFGQSLKQQRSRILQRVSFASTYVKLPAKLTVYENLDFYARLYGIAAVERRQRIMSLLDYFGIAHLAHRETGPLSAGQMTRVMLVKAFCTAPDVVLLDEPTASLDPDIAREVRAFVLQERSARGTAFIFTSHNMDEVQEVCDRVLVMQQGSIIASDTPANLARSIRSSRLTMTVIENADALIRLLQVEEYPFEVVDNLVTIHLDSTDMPHVLHACAHAGVLYSHISIQEPSLEEYFIQLLGRKKG